MGEAQDKLTEVGLSIQGEVIWQEGVHVLVDQTIAVIERGTGSVIVECDGTVSLAPIALPHLMARFFNQVESQYSFYRQRSARRVYQPVYSLKHYFFPAVYQNHAVRAWINLGAVNYLQVRKNKVYFFSKGRIVWELPKTLIGHLMKAPGILLFVRRESLVGIERGSKQCFPVKSLAYVLKESAEKIADKGMPGQVKKRSH